MLVMKVNEVIAQTLTALGVERPTARLVEEVEKLVAAKIETVVEKAVRPRLAAKAFAATLTKANGPQKGVSGMGEAHP